jgi:hypothetical protein
VHFLCHSFFSFIAASGHMIQTQEATQIWSLMELRAADFKSAMTSVGDVDMFVFCSQGVPSLFSDLRPLYDHPDKADILEKIICEVELSLQATGSFPERCFIVITPSVLQIASFI